MKKYFELLNPCCESFEGLPYVEGWEKKENLTSNDCWALRYSALRFITRNFLREDWKEIDDENAFQSSELYLRSFEGYEVNDQYTVRTLFMTKEGRIMADIYDNKTDSFCAYLVD
jgi:hypothetical protein